MESPTEYFVLMKCGEDVEFFQTNEAASIVTCIRSIAENLPSTQVQFQESLWKLLARLDR